VKSPSDDSAWWTVDVNNRRGLFRKGKGFVEVKLGYMMSYRKPRP
jgi:hypothetical protein